MGEEHRALIAEHIDWRIVDARLSKYPSIARTFPSPMLKKAASRSPYYCHYMTPRLAWWPERVPTSGADIFGRVDQLLARAAALPNWSRERSILADTTYAVFWSLLWQLQVMEWLVGIGPNVRWNDGGPDLTIELEGGPVHVECIALRTSLGPREYLEELLSRVDSRLRVEASELPTRATDLERAFNEIVVEAKCWVRSSASEREAEGPLCPPPTLRVAGVTLSLEVRDAFGFKRYVTPFWRGADQLYPSQTLTARVRNKSGDNRRMGPGPRILAINTLQDRKFQSELFHSIRTGQPIGRIESVGFDAVLVSACGIDSTLQTAGAWFAHASNAVPSPIFHAFPMLEAGPLGESSVP